MGKRSGKNRPCITSAMDRLGGPPISFICLSLGSCPGGRGKFANCQGLPDRTVDSTLSNTKWTPQRSQVAKAAACWPSPFSSNPSLNLCAEPRPTSPLTPVHRTPVSTEHKYGPSVLHAGLLLVLPTAHPLTRAPCKSKAVLTWDVGRGRGTWDGAKR